MDTSEEKIPILLGNKLKIYLNTTKELENFDNRNDMSFLNKLI